VPGERGERDDSFLTEVVCQLQKGRSVSGINGGLDFFAPSNVRTAFIFFVSEGANGPRRGLGEQRSLPTAHLFFPKRLR
jgi:hypothetical protein